MSLASPLDALAEVARLHACQPVGIEHQLGQVGPLRAARMIDVCPRKGVRYYLDIPAKLLDDLLK